METTIMMPESVSLEFVTDTVREYLETALWSSTDDDGDPMDIMFDVEDFTPASVGLATEAVTDFIALAGNLLGDMPAETIGHNLWLNRNGHGAGFWDLGLGDRGETLSRIASDLGTSDAYVGDDGMVHLS